MFAGFTFGPFSANLHTGVFLHGECNWKGCPAWKCIFFCIILFLYSKNHIIGYKICRKRKWYTSFCMQENIPIQSPARYIRQYYYSFLWHNCSIKVFRLYMVQREQFNHGILEFLKTGLLLPPKCNWMGCPVWKSIFTVLCIMIEAITVWLIKSVCKLWMISFFYEWGLVPLLIILVWLFFYFHVCLQHNFGKNIYP